MRKYNSAASLGPKSSIISNVSSNSTNSYIKNLNRVDSFVPVNFSSRKKLFLNIFFVCILASILIIGILAPKTKNEPEKYYSLDPFKNLTNDSEIQTTSITSFSKTTISLETYGAEKTDFISNSIFSTKNFIDNNIHSTSMSNSGETTIKFIMNVSNSLKTTQESTGLTTSENIISFININQISTKMNNSTETFAMITSTSYTSSLILTPTVHSTQAISFSSPSSYPKQTGIDETKILTQITTSKTSINTPESTIMTKKFTNISFTQHTGSSSRPTKISTLINNEISTKINYESSTLKSSSLKSSFTTNVNKDTITTTSKMHKNISQRTSKSFNFKSSNSASITTKIPIKTKHIDLPNDIINTINETDYDPNCSESPQIQSVGFLFKKPNTVKDFAFFIKSNELVTLHNFDTHTDIKNNYYIRPEFSDRYRMYNGEEISISSIQKLRNDITILKINHENDNIIPICTLNKHIIMMNQSIKLYEYEIRVKSKQEQSYRLDSKLMAEIILKAKNDYEPCFLGLLDTNEQSPSFNMIRNDLCFYQIDKNYASNIFKGKNRQETIGFNKKNVLLGTVTINEKYFLIGNVVNYLNNQRAFAFFVRK